MSSIYLDHAAATPLRPEVLEAMLPWLTTGFGNPSSLHRFGREAKLALDGARDQLARLLHCRSSELLFTSGGTESDNLAIIGCATAVSPKLGKNHIITTAIEHHAVLHACQALEHQGFEVTYLPVDASGRVSVHDVEAALTDRTLLVSIMYGNNEVGTVQPVEEIGRLAREKGVYLHVDAVQALGMLPIHLSELPIDLASFSAHKINGPRGIGLLYARKEVPLTPILHGGSQERKRRAGTENVAAAAGFAKAMELADAELVDKPRRMRTLRETFLSKLSASLDPGTYVVNTPLEQSLPHIVNVSFLGVSTEAMLMNLDIEGIAAASGSACTSGSLETSHVLQAMGLPHEVLLSAVRFSFGYGTTEEELQQTVQKIATICRRIRR